jgi:hypothetical protein
MGVGVRVVLVKIFDYLKEEFMGREEERAWWMGCA